MEPDLAVAVMEATVKIEQAFPGGRRAVGTGFLIADTGPDGQPRVTLITAEHVLEDMRQVSVSIGFRVMDAAQGWSFRPTDLRIRDDAGQPLWQAHTSRDVAAIVIHVPEDLARRAIPIRYLADQETFARNGVEPGSEMMALGFPRGLASNAAGFPILRAGRIASYPVSPSDQAPTFLMDFSVFPGNSGGPVFLDRDGPDGPDEPSGSAPGHEAFVAGILTQQVEVDQQPLGIGIVTHARFVRETIALIGQLPQMTKAPVESLPVLPPGDAVNALAMTP